jgi:hypothetical protein
VKIRYEDHKQMVDCIEAHRHSSANESEVNASDRCGCFYCLRIFQPSGIEEWKTRSGKERTAICPYCRIDSVIGSKSGYPIDEGFLLRMSAFWFTS